MAQASDSERFLLKQMSDSIPVVGLFLASLKGAMNFPAPTGRDLSITSCEALYGIRHSYMNVAVRSRFPLRGNFPPDENFLLEHGALK
jgi:hypothetical protein